MESFGAVMSPRNSGYSQIREIMGKISTACLFFGRFAKCEQQPQRMFHRALAHMGAAQGAKFHRLGVLYARASDAKAHPAFGFVV